MQHILFNNLTTKNNAIVALCFVASAQVLWNDETNPGRKLNNILDGSFERSKVAIV